MGRPPRHLPAARSVEHPLPSTEDVLRALVQVMGPLARLLLASGVDYTRLAAELKPLFIEQARLELLRSGQNATDSAISLLSGVHRKDVRAWRMQGLSSRIEKEVSISSRIFARWVQDPLYRDRRRRPRPLPRLGPAPSFDTLARSVTQDVHPYTALTELLRLGLVTVKTVKGRDIIVPHQEGFVPPAGSRDLLDLFGANLADHASAAVANLLGQPPRLEQSVFAEGVTPETAKELGELARKLWAQARSEMIAEATRRYEADKDRSDANCRVRFGAYYWAEDEAKDGSRSEGGAAVPRNHAGESAANGGGDED
ncbi:DUF6502 family protein [Thiomonas bhubaneswarensis]|uniref:Uncharacterized protein n=1 Tax=Thiomonas bhubaneswarensis TaxID=339866 RepID=A0A0K6I6M2_9BURK|nr:DUF6502 family protein [Thiomonas bhubaneswarensis]CUA98794.1 hypothetical protein Ga0061069_10834 [Thiomonas bhubaneswarensis]